ncbi:hypothetical protein BvCmsKSNP073_00408 [Escherichia coli]|nr:hypothetical protein BvCmsKSNP073_00408 [Escherichia coli]
MEHGVINFRQGATNTGDKPERHRQPGRHIVHPQHQGGIRHIDDMHGTFRNNQHTGYQNEHRNKLQHFLRVMAPDINKKECHRGEESHYMKQGVPCGCADKRGHAIKCRLEELTATHDINGIHHAHQLPPVVSCAEDTDV